MKEASTPKKHAQGSVRKRHVDQQPAPNVPAFEEQMGRPVPIANMITRSTSPAINETGVTNVPDGFSRATSAEPLPLDPALFENGSNSTQHEEQTMVPVTLPQSISPSAVLHHREPSDKATCKWQISDACPAPDIEIGTATFRSRESFEPLASSLVSPPASSHDDADISPINAHAGWKSSTASSRHSSSQPKHMQRYTPDSGSMRRASSSSYGENAQEKAASPVMAGLSSEQKHKPIIGSEIFTDEESMRLIKELQAEEYGLRRRGKA